MLGTLQTKPPNAVSTRVSAVLNPFPLRLLLVRAAAVGLCAIAASTNSSLYRPCEGGNERGGKGIHLEVKDATLNTTYI